MAATDRPNIVCILHDNTGWGDWGAYGGATATPRIDELAEQGIRFTNYTVESQCTPTRSAMLTGRLPVRTGCYKVPLPGTGPYGMCPWEYTTAELLSHAGYATAAYGKWHVGEHEGRLPNDQGFDHWWGLKNSTDEAAYSSFATFRALAEKGVVETPKIWEGVKGGEANAVRDLDMEVRPFLDEIIVQKTTDFIKQKAKDGVPFYTYVALTHFHPREAVHPDFDQTSPDRLGLYADVVAEQDHRTGQILDALDEAGIADNTFVMLLSDNATGGLAPGLGGSNGPWHGNFFTPPFEGSVRAPAIVRWPGKIPAGVVSDEMLTSVDWYRTIATFAGAADRVPDDRPIDGVDAAQFMLGKAKSTGRESVLIFGPDGEPMAVKYGNFKVILRYGEGVDKPLVEPYFPLFFDLSSDPGENYNLTYEKLDMAWMMIPIAKVLVEYKLSTVQYPNIEVGEDFEGYKGVKKFVGEAKAAYAERKMEKAGG
ncbi:MAG: sulfatase-like hydrolase/transferase [Solirubrobacteraceae bacterium]